MSKAEFSYTYSKTITPDSFYGAAWAKYVPEGYKVVDFRPTRLGDIFLNAWNIICNCDGKPNLPSEENQPRLILAKDYSSWKNEKLEVTPEMIYGNRLDEILRTYGKDIKAFRRVLVREQYIDREGDLSYSYCGDNSEEAFEPLVAFIV